MAIAFTSGVVFTPTKVLKESTVIVSDMGEIIFIGPDATAPKIAGKKINLRGKILAPGFIDQHVHGGHGLNFLDDDPKGKRLEQYSLDTVQNGIVAFLTGLVPKDPNALVKKMDEYVTVFEKGLPGAEGLGFFLEGPYMNPDFMKKRSSVAKEFLYTPSLEETMKFIDTGKGWVKLITIAPDIENGMEIARLFRKAGAVISLGGTECSYDVAKVALQKYHTNIDHIFNGFDPFHHRTPGAVGAALSCDSNITCEINTDMFHVHPAGVIITMRCFGMDRMIIVTDGMLATGLPDGIFRRKDGREVTVKDHKVTLPDGTIASSASPMNRNIKLVVEKTGIALHESIQMATLNPARALGISDRLGSIAIGKDASLVVIDEDVNIYLTMVNGKIVYSKI